MVIVKVRVGQLKAGLSKYLRTVRETGEPIEVCVREKRVAYLTPAAQEKGTDAASRRAIEAQLQRHGLSVVQWRRKPELDLQPEPPGDGNVSPNSVVAMRREKDW